MIVFYVERDSDGQPWSLFRVVDYSPSLWTPNGWVPSHFDWTGIGGATEYDVVTKAETVRVLRGFGLTSGQAAAAVSI